jgi:hypothetical protein
MTKMSTPKKSISAAISPEERARREILRQYESVKQAWKRELENDRTDSALLIRLYHQMLAMECRSPWLNREEAQA